MPRSRRQSTAIRAKIAALLGLLCGFFAVGPPKALGATVVVENADAPDVGFNDTTPATPVGGNPGTTRGEQALLAVQFAADLWGAELDSDVPIIVEARFARLDCTATTGNLGSATASRLIEDSPGTLPGTWYPIALANRLAGRDLLPDAADIQAEFNGGLGAADCLAGPGWYFGFDSNSGNQTDLVDLAVHELAHGLGMTTFADLETGAFHEDSPDIFLRFVFDRAAGSTWADMTTDAERARSARNAQRVVWNGPSVRSAAASFLDSGFETLSFAAPLDDFDPPLGLPEVGPGVPDTELTAELVMANDGTGAVTDACEPLSDTTGSAVVIDGGGCSDVDKVLAAQNAGAPFAILIDDATAPPPRPVTGDDGGLVTIPAVRVSLDDGAVIKGELPGLEATLWVDPDRLVGTDRQGRPYLYATDPVRAGRSITHWDPIISPDLLMEPDVAPRAEHGLDLALALLEDIGWTPFVCGDGRVEGGEECDAGEDNGTMSSRCRSDCTWTSANDAGAPDSAAPALDAGTAEGGVDAMRPPLRDSGANADGAAPPPASDASPNTPDAQADAQATDGGVTPSARNGGCGCRAAAPKNLRAAWVALIVLVIGAARRRRPSRVFP